MLENASEFAARMSAPTLEGNWFVFCNAKFAQPKTLLKHIRNAAAHGHIVKFGNKLSLKSHNTQGKENMRGEITLNLFEPFITALVATATTKEIEGAKE
jgi:hypothetical protein